MKNNKSLLIVGGIILLLIICVCLVGGGLIAAKIIRDGGIPNTGINNGFVTPKPGLWRASSEFGPFTFVVSTHGAGINQFDFGGVNIKTDDEEGYPIRNSSFKSSLDFIWIEGTFTSGTAASGTWRYLKKGGSGKWTATWAGS
jgi:hypothetical protein